MAVMTTIPFKDLVMEGADFANPRTAIDGRAINELADSIEKHDLMYPLAVWRTKGDNGKQLNVVVDGGRRFRAIGKLVAQKRANGLSKAVPIRVVAAKTLSEARIKALTGNLQRVELSSYEVTSEMIALLDAGMAQKEIATQISKSATWVSRQLSAYKKAAPAVLKAWRARKLPDDDVQTLSKLEHPEQERRLEKLMAHRGDGESSPKATRADRSKARTIAKGAEPEERMKRPGADKIASFAKITADAPKKSAYVRGMHDAFRFVLGELGAGEFDKEYSDFAAGNGFMQTDKKPAAKKPAAKKKVKKPAAKKKVKKPAAKKSAIAKRK